MEVTAASELYQPSDLICPHPKCGLAFGNLRTLKKHFELHNTSSQVVRCTKCFETCVDLTSYEKHVKNNCGQKEGITPVHKTSRRSDPEPPSSKRQREPENYEELAEEHNVAVPVDTNNDVLDQHIAAMTMRNNNQIYQCQQRENDLISGLEECSFTLDRALHMIMLMSGGNLDNIPIDLQHTSLKYSANRRQVYRPPEHYNNGFSSDSGENKSDFRAERADVSGSVDDGRYNHHSVGDGAYYSN